MIRIFPHRPPQSGHLSGIVRARTKTHQRLIDETRRSHGGPGIFRGIVLPKSRDRAIQRSSLIRIAPGQLFGKCLDIDPPGTATVGGTDRLTLGRHQLPMQRDTLVLESITQHRDLLDGETQRPDYGAVINGAAPPNGQNLSLDQMTSQIVQNLQQSNQGMQQIGQPQAITVNGIRGRSVDLSSTSPIQGPNGQRQGERDWLVTLPRNDGSVVFLIFIAPQSDFDNLRPTYESMLRSVRID